MKNILLTGGPTNEYIDEVMKITNMSTGSLTLSLAKAALESGDNVSLIITDSVMRSKLFSEIEGNSRLSVHPIETTQDMYDALKEESKKHFDVVLHAAAVGDYKPEFTFRMEDMAQEIADKLYEEGLYPGADDRLKNADAEILKEKILEIMKEGRCRVKNDSKISSYEENLTVKLTLTTKVIANLRNWFPGALLIGCKLLENVSREHLIEVATKLCIKNDMDYIMANDLAVLRSGQPIRLLIDKNGYTGIELNGNGPKLIDYAKEKWFL